MYNIPRHALNEYKGSVGIAPLILILGSRWGWSDLCSSHFAAWKKVPGAK